MSNREDALEIAVELCKEFEGFKEEAYLCPAGVATIGYGSTIKPNGDKVTLDDGPISEEEATGWLKSTLEKVADDVLKSSPTLIDYTECLAAIIDFTYNLGIGNYNASTLKKRVDVGAWRAAEFEIRRWTKAGGRELPGLVRRRDAEAELISAGLLARA